MYLCFFISFAIRYFFVIINLLVPKRRFTYYLMAPVCNFLLLRLYILQVALGFSVNTFWKLKLLKISDLIPRFYDKRGVHVSMQFDIEIILDHIVFGIK